MFCMAWSQNFFVCVYTDKFSSISIFISHPLLLTSYRIQSLHLPFVKKHVMFLLFLVSPPPCSPLTVHSLTAMGMERSRLMSWRRVWRPSWGRNWRKASWRRSSLTLTSTKTATLTLTVSGWGLGGEKCVEEWTPGKVWKGIKTINKKRW